MRRSITSSISIGRSDRDFATGRQGGSTQKFHYGFSSAKVLEPDRGRAPISPVWL
jgi:hypothetical protein